MLCPSLLQIKKGRVKKRRKTVAFEKRLVRKMDRLEKRKAGAVQEAVGSAIEAVVGAAVETARSHGGWQDDRVAME